MRLIRRLPDLSVFSGLAITWPFPIPSIVALDFIYDRLGLYVQPDRHGSGPRILQSLPRRAHDRERDPRGGQAGFVHRRNGTAEPLAPQTRPRTQAIVC